MKTRKNDVTPPPFVKEVFQKPTAVLHVRQSIHETLPLDAIAGVQDMPLDLKRNLLAKWEERVFELHTQYVEAIAIRDALAMHVKTNLIKPHWIRHASLQSLYGAGGRLLPCAKCGKGTEWSFDGKPQCTLYKNEIPVNETHAICTVETGTRKHATHHERDVANLLSTYEGAGIAHKKSPTKKGNNK